jgi:hypothetical protein
MSQASDDLRQMIGDVDSPQMFDDSQLLIWIDERDNDLNLTAAYVWGLKAGKYAQLVDVTDGGASRKMSQLQTQAIKMQQFYASLVSEANPPVATDAPKTRAITRP